MKYLPLLTALLCTPLAASAADGFVPASAPPKGAKPSPLTGEEQRASFTVPPGFEVELVAQEEEGFGKFITVDWDQRGRMWSMTAFEYPVDGNESAAQAKALYSAPGKDRVIIFDTPFAAGVQKPRVFVDGLAIPLGILPYKNGVYVQHGNDLKFFKDTDNDGKADAHDIVVTGFGVQDSHLFPHQFTRAPGGWLWMAQGLFNNSKVQKPGSDKVVDWPKCSMAKMRPDGTEFEVTSVGPNNIWGFVLDAEGQAWMQEANDYGYPVMPFHEYADYPGGMDSFRKSYQPGMPPSTNFAMGGTGLSGLALSDKKGAWPAAYADVMYVANPITRKIQAIKITPDGSRFKYTLLGDFMLSSDEWFRPISIHFGPDGCLYVVDWYNKIISHNEVPRQHKDRDKTRGRIWRVKATGQTPFVMADFTKLPGDQLVAKLGGDSLTQSHLAWQAITDRADASLSPKLIALIGDTTKPAGARIAALWAAEGLGKVDAAVLRPLLADENRNVRREAVRAFGEARLPGMATALAALAEDADTTVRAEVIRVCGRVVAKDPQALALCVAMGRDSLSGAAINNKGKVPAGDAYDREFERFLVRFFLEKQPEAVAAWLDSPDAAKLPVEKRLLASFALEPKTSAKQVAQLLPKLTRPPGQEEVMRLVQFIAEPGIGEALTGALTNPATRPAVLNALLAARTRIDTVRLNPLLADAAKKLLAGDNEGRELALRLATEFRLTALEPDLAALLTAATPADRQLTALRALREMGSTQADLFAKLAKESKDAAIRDEAINALATSKSEAAGKLLLAMWRDLTPVQRRGALDRLSTQKPGAQAVVAAVRAGTIAKTEIDGPTLDKLQTILGANDPDLGALMNELSALFRPVLALDGSDAAASETGVTLDGPFTVETWVLLNPKGRPIGPSDAILGTPGQFDMNFFGGNLRVFAANADAIVAKKLTVPGVWIHVAITRDEKGALKIYQDGLLDQDQGKPVTQKLENVQIGWSYAKGGTAGALSEFRIWNRARSADEIRDSFDRSFEGGAKPAGLVFYAPGAGPWGKLGSAAKITKTSDFPPILTPAEATALDAKFAKYRALADQPGDAARGKTVTLVCQACHTIQGQGGNLAPNLSGAGAMGVEALLRNIITPNAAMENGYRLYRVELNSGDLAEGFLASEEKDAIVLRAPGAQDRRIARADIRAGQYLRRSIMPEGLLDTMTAGQVSDMFTYLKTLK
ncbi:MAG: HEAT repeat domain-containing protein [Chthoniobacter sp.]|nr:HEAT repeat domain-containing protein [Chthoniobacter sp.]